MDEENNIDNPFFDFWEKLDKFGAQTLRTKLQEFIMNNNTTEQEKYADWLSRNVELIFNTYVHGLKINNLVAINTPLLLFPTYMYVVEVYSKKENVKVVKPEPMMPSKVELDAIFDEKKIKSEIDDILKGIE
jgi:hypothetical protein